jgi:hypothetical protein
MRLVKAAFIGIIGISVLITLISFLLPSEIHGRRGLAINSSRERLMAQLGSFDNWKNWHPEFKANPGSIRYRNVGTGQNATATVEANGKTTTYLITYADSATVKVLQQRPGQNDIENTFTLAKDSTSGAIYADWKFISTLKWYPWEKFAGMLTESMTAPGYDAGLNNLKAITEGAN